MDFFGLFYLRLFKKRKLMSYWQVYRIDSDATFTEFKYRNKTQASTVVTEIELRIYKDGNLCITAFGGLELERYEEMVGRLTQAGFRPPDNSSSITSHEQRDPLKIKEFFEIIRRFEPIDEVNYKEMLRNLGLRTPLEELTEKIGMLIEQGKLQEAADAAQSAQNEGDDFDTIWNLIKRFESEQLVEPSTLIDLYEAISPKSPHFQKVHLPLFALQTPLAEETPAQKTKRLEKMLPHAVASDDITLIYQTFNELSGQGFSGPPANNITELLVNAASAIRKSQEQLEELKTYQAKKEADAKVEARLHFGTFKEKPSDTQESPKTPEDFPKPRHS
jgi:hypothetical protein